MVLYIIYVMLSQMTFVCLCWKRTERHVLEHLEARSSARRPVQPAGVQQDEDKQAMCYHIVWVYLIPTSNIQQQ